MAVKIQGGQFSAAIAETGAELRSLVSLATGREHIWSGDPAWWSGTAPILFPVIGGLKDGAFSFEGRQYKLPSHGFARTSDFTVIRAEADGAELELRSSAKTREIYPFDFSLKASFSITPMGIAVRYVVENMGTGRMYFSIGSHPAFVLPFAGGALENYYVLFDREEALERWFFSDGLVVADRTAEILENSRVITLSRTLFDQGVLIFKHPVSHRFTIKNSLNPRSITVTTDGVPYLGIWSKPNGAPFLCIEPWHGLPDSTTAGGPITEKEGIISLAPREKFATGYGIEIS